MFSITASAQNVPDTLEQRLKACTSCHGAQGRAGTDGYYPRIAGKPEGYLFNQLKNFRDGKRTFPMMTYMVANMSDDYLREIATYFSNQHPPYAAPQKPDMSPALLERGRVLVLHGDQDKKIPACVACHGQKLTGLAPFVPGIAGLPKDYLIAQLGAWQTGTRHAAAPDCMQLIANKLGPEDVAALSGWLAMQYVADGGVAAVFKGNPKGDYPLACGSIPGS
ncbi:c-type cytochrome [Undibacterium sp. Ji67W]|uniref:c-type cytochrome n=1 Tax=Undibacterium sp. Ji67W TaxID=3413042 RepID=UPI003BF17394